MSEQMAGFRYWQIEFDEEGQAAVAGQFDAMVNEVGAARIGDLFIFSHGWNNSRTIARDLYERFFGQLHDVMQSQGMNRATVGIAGVIWPSMRWADEAPSGGRAAASLGPVHSDADMAADLKNSFAKPEHVQAIDEMAELLRRRPKDPAAFARFHALLKVIAPSDDAPEDSGERDMLAAPPEKAFQKMASLDRARPAAAGIGDAFEQLWNGAKEALRAASYWQMKSRAGTVGQVGLGPLIGRLNALTPALRIHLLGHSFGARVVSFALSGLPAGLDGTASPVKSLTLLQGAFSHFAFADQLPTDTTRGGALKGMQSRVDGPLIVSHSKKDLAVGKLYPKASFVSRDDASAATNAISRWGAMGSDGAQSVPAGTATFQPVGSAYQFPKGTFTNLDGNQLIVRGEPPSGAHSDIVYPQIAWALLSAARIGKQP